MFAKAINATEKLFADASASMRASERLLTPGARSLFVGSAVAAPVLFSNKDRDPVQTAFVTTPTLAVAFAAAPAAMVAFKRITKTGNVLWKHKGELERVVKNSDIYAFRRLKASIPKEYWHLLKPAEAETEAGFFAKGMKSAQQLAADRAARVSKHAERVREHYAYLMEDADEKQWQSAAAAFKESAIAARPMDEQLRTRLKEVELPEGEGAKAFVKDMMDRFVPETGDVDAEFVTKLRQRLKQNRKTEVATGDPNKPFRRLKENEYPVLADHMPAKPMELATVSNQEEILEKLRPGHEDLVEALERRWSSLKNQGYSDLELKMNGDQIRGLVLRNQDAKKSLYLGVVDRASGRVYTGKEFQTTCVGSRLLQVKSGNELQDFWADTFGVEFAGRISDKDLQKNINAATSWENRFGETLKEANEIEHGNFATYTYSHSAVPIDAPVHWHAGDNKEVNFKDLTYAQVQDVVKARVARGEETSGSTGPLSKDRMFRKPDFELSHRLDKPSTVDVTSYKEWELMEQVPERYRTSVTTEELLQTTEKFGRGVDRYVELISAGASPASMEYMGTISAFAEHAKLPHMRKDWEEAFAKDLGVARNQLDLNSEQMKKNYHEFVSNKVKSAFAETSYTTPEEKAWYEATRGKLRQLFQNGMTGEQDAAKVAQAEEKLFNEVTGLMSRNQKMLDVANKIGMGSGEGNALIDEGIKGIKAWRHQTHDLAYITEDLQKFLAVENGQLKEGWKDMMVHGKFALGYNDSAGLTLEHAGEGQNHLITAIRPYAEEGTGRTRYKVETAVLEDINSRNLKLAYGGTKNANVPVDMQKARELLNKFNTATGSAKFAEDVDLIIGSATGNLKYALNGDDLAAQAVQFLREANHSGSDKIRAAATDAMKVMQDQFGFHYGDNRIRIDTGYFDKMAQAKYKGTRQEARLLYHEDLLRSLYGNEPTISRSKAELMTEAQLASEDLVKNYGVLGKMEMVMHREANRDPEVARRMGLFKIHRHQSEDGARFSDYLRMNHMPVRAGVMESSVHHRSRKVAPTEDMLQQLSRNEMYYQARDIMARTRAIGSGDSRQTAKVLDWLKSGDYDKMPAERVFAIDKTRSVLSDPTGTILDSRRKDLQDVFTYQLSDAVKVKWGEDEERVFNHVLHPGYAGFGGAPNLYNDKLDEARARGLQESWENLVKVDARHKTSGLDKTELAAAVKKYTENFNTVVGGKHNMLRPVRFDPFAFGGFTPQKVVTTPTEEFDLFLQPAEWEERVSRLPESIKKMADEKQFFYASHARHPINTTAYVRVRKHSGLGEHQIGMGDFYRELNRGDFDFDPADVFPTTSLEAWNEAHERVTNIYGRQWDQARERNWYRNLEQNVNITQDYIKANKETPFVEAALKGLRPKDGKTAVQLQHDTVQSRLAGRYIGRFSHLTTRFQLGLESVPGLSFDADLQEAMRGFMKGQVAGEEGIWAIRQMSIALQKKDAAETKDPLKFVDAFLDAFEKGDEKGADDFLKLVQEAVKMNPEQEGVWNKDLAERFSYLRHESGREFKIGEEINLLHEVLRQNDAAKESIRNVVLGGQSLSAELAHTRIQHINNAFELLTRKGKAEEGAIWKTLAQLHDASEYLATHRSNAGLGAETSAKGIAAINAMYKAAAHEGRGLLKPAGKVALAGALVAGAAGIAMVGSPDQMKGARAPKPPANRPEEQIGVTDQVPGSPETGYMSGNPQRNVAFKNGVNRSVVAPMRRSHQTDVELSGPDEGGMDLFRKRVSAVSPGQAFITNNHIGGWRDGSTKLATRERLREDLDRY